MFKKNKLTLAVAFSISALSWGIANADKAQYPAGAPLSDTDKVSETSPTFVFDYDPAMSGVIVDLTEGLDEDGDSITTALTTDATQCAPVSEIAFLGLSDMSCSATGCEWIPSTPLVDQAVYYLNYEKVVNGMATLPARADCNGDSEATGGVAIAVDTSAGGGGTPVPTAPPEQVVITTNPGDSCTIDATADCVIKFKHANNPAASHYRVWISDKNGIQIDEDTLSAKANQDVDVNGWFEVDTKSSLDPGNARVSCTPQLDGSRECKLEIEGADTESDADVHPAIADLKAGKKFRVWVRAWNAKGYADWSDSVEIDID